MTDTTGHERHHQFLDNLTDVDVPAPADGDVLTFDEGTGLWKPTAGGGGGGGGGAVLVFSGFTGADGANTDSLAQDEPLWTPDGGFPLGSAPNVTVQADNHANLHIHGAGLFIVEMILNVAPDLGSTILATHAELSHSGAGPNPIDVEGLGDGGQGVSAGTKVRLHYSGHLDDGDVVFAGVTATTDAGQWHLGANGLVRILKLA